MKYEGVVQAARSDPRYVISSDTSLEKCVDCGIGLGKEKSRQPVRTVLIEHSASTATSVSLNDIIIQLLINKCSKGVELLWRN